MIVPLIAAIALTAAIIGVIWLTVARLRYWGRFLADGDNVAGQHFVIWYALLWGEVGMIVYAIGSDIYEFLKGLS